MTEKQRKFFYFPAWNRCCMANSWHMIQGRMSADARRTDPAAPEYEQIWAMAEAAARISARAVTVDDLRHACHTLALGSDHSSAALTNKQVNRVVDLFQYLQDPEDIDLVMRWQNPGVSEHRSLVSYIRKRAPEEYICAIARDRWDTIFWEDRSIEELRWLSGQLAYRNLAWRRPVQSAPAEPAGKGPF